MHIISKSIFDDCVQNVTMLLLKSCVQRTVSFCQCWERVIRCLFHYLVLTCFSGEIVQKLLYKNTAKPFYPNQCLYSGTSINCRNRGTCPDWACQSEAWSWTRVPTANVGTKERDGKWDEVSASKTGSRTCWPHSGRCRRSADRAWPPACKGSWWSSHLRKVRSQAG